MSVYLEETKNLTKNKMKIKGYKENKSSKLETKVLKI